jgi:hypothetical protein
VIIPKNKKKRVAPNMSIQIGPKRDVIMQNKKTEKLCNPKVDLWHVS